MGEIPNFNPQALAEEARKILENRELVYDIAGRRLALVASNLNDYLSRPENTFHIAIVGNPNRSKTTYAYSCYEDLEEYGVPSSYHDLDIYTQSGKAIAGEIAWNQRIKRSLREISETEITKSIQSYHKDQSGVVIADFPGKLDDPYQIERLKGSDLAIVLGRDREEIRRWEKLCSDNNVGHRFLISETQPPLPYTVLYPSFYNLTRKPRFSPMLLVSVTSVLQQIAEMRSLNLPGWERYFNKAELVVLREVLDFTFSIRMDE